jgi:hypothetical protein
MVQVYRFTGGKLAAERHRMRKPLKFSMRYRPLLAHVIPEPNIEESDRARLNTRCFSASTLARELRKSRTSLGGTRKIC